MSVFVLLIIDSGFFEFIHPPPHTQMHALKDKAWTHMLTQMHRCAYTHTRAGTHTTAVSRLCAHLGTRLTLSFLIWKTCKLCKILPCRHIAKIL